MYNKILQRENNKSLRALMAMLLTLMIVSVSAIGNVTAMADTNSTTNADELELLVEFVDHMGSEKDNIAVSGTFYVYMNDDDIVLNDSKYNDTKYTVVVEKDGEVLSSLKQVCENDNNYSKGEYNIYASYSISETENYVDDKSGVMDASAINAEDVSGTYTFSIYDQADVDRKAPIATESVDVDRFVITGNGETEYWLSSVRGGLDVNAKIDSFMQEGKIITGFKTASESAKVYVLADYTYGATWMSYAATQYFLLNDVVANEGSGKSHELSVVYEDNNVAQPEDLAWLDQYPGVFICTITDDANFAFWLEKYDEETDSWKEVCGSYPDHAYMYFPVYNKAYFTPEEIEERTSAALGEEGSYFLNPDTNIFVDSYFRENIIDPGKYRVGAVAAKDYTSVMTTPITVFSDTLEVNFSERLDTPENLRWDESKSYFAKWDAVDGAAYYEVDLFYNYGDTPVLSSYTVDTECDFSHFIENAVGLSLTQDECVVTVRAISIDLFNIGNSLVATLPEDAEILGNKATDDAEGADSTDEESALDGQDQTIPDGDMNESSEADGSDGEASDAVNGSDQSQGGETQIHEDQGEADQAQVEEEQTALMEQQLVITKSKWTTKAKELAKTAVSFRMECSVIDNAKLVFKKKSGSDRLSISKDGEVKIKKKTRAGVYKMKVRVTAKKTENYAKQSKSVTVKIKVK